MWISLLAVAAFAQDAITLSAVKHAQDGLSEASLTLHAAVDGQMQVALSCGGSSFPLVTAIEAGNDYTILLHGLAKGAHVCKGTLALQAADGTSGEMPLSLQVEIHPPLQLTARRNDVDLAAHRLVVHADRPVKRVSVEVIGEGGTVIGRGEASGDASSSLPLEWTGTGDVVLLRVTGWDAWDLPGTLELSPWSYVIPHEDVVFASGLSALDASELPKLEKAWTELETVRTKYGDLVPIRLFVGGYTDTVGTNDSNTALSLARAQSIAGWFRSRGFAGPIAYQGFGESGLAVPTGDSVNEAKNRRAVYVLAAEAPAVSTQMPRSDWQTLK